MWDQVRPRPSPPWPCRLQASWASALPSVSGCHVESKPDTQWHLLSPGRLDGDSEGVPW